MCTEFESETVQKPALSPLSLSFAFLLLSLKLSRGELAWIYRAPVGEIIRKRISPGATRPKPEKTFLDGRRLRRNRWTALAELSTPSPGPIRRYLRRTEEREELSFSSFFINPLKGISIYIYKSAILPISIYFMGYRFVRVSWKGNGHWMALLLRYEYLDVGICRSSRGSRCKKWNPYNVCVFFDVSVSNVKVSFLKPAASGRSTDSRINIITITEG